MKFLIFLIIPAVLLEYKFAYGKPTPDKPSNTEQGAATTNLKVPGHGHGHDERRGSIGSDYDLVSVSGSNLLEPKSPARPGSSGSFASASSYGVVSKSHGSVYNEEDNLANPVVDLKELEEKFASKSSANPSQASQASEASDDSDSEDDMTKSVPDLHELINKNTKQSMTSGVADLRDLKGKYHSSEPMTGGVEDLRKLTISPDKHSTGSTSKTAPATPAASATQKKTGH